MVRLNGDQKHPPRPTTMMHLSLINGYRCGSWGGCGHPVLVAPSRWMRREALKKDTRFTGDAWCWEQVPPWLMGGGHCPSIDLNLAFLCARRATVTLRQEVRTITTSRSRARAPPTQITIFSSLLRLLILHLIPLPPHLDLTRLRNIEEPLQTPQQWVSARLTRRPSTPSVFWRYVFPWIPLLLAAPPWL